jgi:hypothetical protein
LRFDRTRRLEVVLAGVKTTNDCDVQVDYTPWNLEGVTAIPATTQTVTNGATDVVALAAPSANSQLNEIDKIFFYNRDTANVTVTIKSDVAAGGGTEYIYFKGTIATLKTLCWTKETGFYVTTA